MTQATQSLYGQQCNEIFIKCGAGAFATFAGWCHIATPAALAHKFGVRIIWIRSVLIVGTRTIHRRICHNPVCQHQPSAFSCHPRGHRQSDKMSGTTITTTRSTFLFSWQKLKCKCARFVDSARRRVRAFPFQCATVQFTLMTIITGWPLELLEHVQLHATMRSAQEDACQMPSTSENR